MKTGFDVLKTLFPIVNVAGVTALIDGGVYKWKKPVNSVLQDIVLLQLPMRNNVAVQPVIIMVNMFCKNHKNGIPDETNLVAITEKVIEVLEDYSNTSGTYFDIEIMAQTLLQDNEQKDMSYVNLRINILIEKGES